MIKLCCDEHLTDDWQLLGNVERDCLAKEMKLGFIANGLLLAKAIHMQAACMHGEHNIACVLHVAWDAGVLVRSMQLHCA